MPTEGTENRLPPPKNPNEKAGRLTVTTQTGTTWYWREEREGCPQNEHLLRCLPGCVYRRRARVVTGFVVP